MKWEKLHFANLKVLLKRNNFLPRDGNAALDNWITYLFIKQPENMKLVNFGNFLKLTAKLTTK